MRRGRGKAGGRLRACLGWLILGFIQVYAHGGETGMAVSAPPDELTNASLPQRAYIWQRVWSPTLRSAVRDHTDGFGALDVLAAEISFGGPEPRITYNGVAWAVLRDRGLPVGLVVRIGPCASSWSENVVETRTVIAVCRQVMAVAAAHQVKPAELQVDFDAASSRLRDYQALVREIRLEVSPCRLVVTTLPAWLGKPGFRELVNEADAYVLQVHSLEKPKSANAPFSLCYAVRANQWIDVAAAFGRPFRVALPAYGYRIGFDATGRFAGLQAEGPPRPWPDGTQLRTIWAEPSEVVRIITKLMSHRPAVLESVCWFRLPTDHDELAWHWRTLAAVAKGLLPQAHLVFHPVWTADGAVECLVVNEGDDRAAPCDILVSWQDARFVGGDVLGKWRLERRTDSSLLLHAPQDGSVSALQPGASAKLGWLRLTAHVELHVRVLANQERYRAVPDQDGSP